MIYNEQETMRFLKYYEIKQTLQQLCSLLVNPCLCFSMNTYLCFPDMSLNSSSCLYAFYVLNVILHVIFSPFFLSLFLFDFF